MIESEERFVAPPGELVVSRRVTPLGNTSASPLAGAMFSVQLAPLVQCPDAEPSHVLVAAEAEARPARSAIRDRAGWSVENFMA